MNQFYNKQKAKYIRILRQGKAPHEGTYTSKRLDSLHNTRFFKLKDLFHKASKALIQVAVEENISVIYVGYNKGWKDALNMGKRNTQSFTAIPHSLFVRMLEYKAAEHGIQVIRVEESYTSKASFLDHDALPVYGKEAEKPMFAGRRIKRGLYRTKTNQLLNADVNGAANILAKAVKEKSLDRTTVNVFHPEARVIA